MRIEENFPLGQLTTVKTGGNAEYFSRVQSSEELVEALTWADSKELQIHMVGSGSNLLVADAGVDGLVLKLAGELSQTQRVGSSLICGAGARLPSVAALAAREGLSGLEFGINIPGTVGGAVRMNANAYGGELAEVLEWVEIVDCNGTVKVGPKELGFSYRNSKLRSGQVVARATFALQPQDSSLVKQRLADLRQRRKDAQPSGIKTFGSTFKNPTDAAAEGRTSGQLLELAGCRGLQVGGACFSNKHANFVENTGTATTADVLELMAAGREAVYKMFGIQLEPEVQILGSVVMPESWELT